MLSSTQWELRRPKDDKLFEELTRDLFAAHWGDPNTQINGRSGQEQRGVDVYGQPNQREFWFGIQCKLREYKLTKSTIECEIKKARNFRHKLHTYIFVTTMPRDTKLQETVEELNRIERESGSFRVQIRFWEDICSLLDEHRRLIEKYYGEGGHPKELTYQPSEQHPTEITRSSPLLVGVLVDLSNTMINTLAKMPKRSGISQKHLNEAINLVAEKALAYCKTPEAEEILPLFSLFVYGYGFGRLRHSVNSLFYRMGIRSTQFLPDLIPTDPIRDLFTEAAARESAPFTPTARALDIHWSIYKQSVEAQFLDVGLGRPILYDALVTTHKRFNRELERPYYEHPILLVISDGNLSGAKDRDLDRIVRDIEQLGIRIVCCYINPKNVTESRNLYDSPSTKWPQTALRLFQCASVVSDHDYIENEIIRIAQEKHWQIPKEAKWFIQLNQTEMLEELIEILLSPLKSKGL
jgi:hypothetical protein